MKNAARQGARSCAIIKNTILFSTLILSLIACTGQESDNSNLSNQRHLIAELERNHLIWAQSGVEEYSFELNKSCADCPEDLQSQQEITVKNDANTTVSAKTGFGARAISAREDDDDNRRRRTQSQQPLRIDSLFTDLRQAILTNSVQQVAYDPVFGFPQTVSVFNNPALQTNNRQVNVQALDDDDDDFRNVRPTFTIQTNRFQPISRNTTQNNVLQNLSLRGQLVRQNNPSTNAANQFWLVENNGQWKQLNVPANLLSTVNAIPNQSFVDISGQWQPGGVNGQGFINLQSCVQQQTNPLQTNLNGSLFYTVANNDDYDLDDFYVTNGAGRNIFLNLPAKLQSLALKLAGQRVNLNGNWTPFFNAPNARFNPNALNPVNTVLEQFTGIIQQGSTFSVPGLQQSNYILVDDFGTIIELQIPNNILNNTFGFVGQRVTVYGSRINSGLYGQSVVSVQGISINQQQNVFTNTQISGTITAVLPTDIYGVVERVLLQTDTGSTVTVQIPSTYRDPFNPLTAGMRIQVSGVWGGNSAFAQGEFEARSPVQIINLGFTTNNTYSGYISNVGSISSGTNCNAQQTVYGFTTDTGQQFQLYVNNTTLISGLNNQNINIPYQARVQVTGLQVTPGVLQATSITVSPQYETTISGTIIEIGSVGNTFTCAGALNTYRLLDNFGNAYLITTTSNTAIQGSQGTFLRIGDVVQVNGTLGSDGSSFYASRIISTTSNNPGVPFPNNPIPNNNASQFVGTVTGLDCTDGFTDTYNFVDQSGTLYKLRMDLNVQPNVFVDVGVSLQVSGSVFNNEIIAQQVTQLQTFADPLNRIPVSGSVISLISTSPSTCNNPVYTYQFQNDNGQTQQLRLTNEAALHLPQPVVNGTRLTILARVQSMNTQLMDATEVQIQNTTGQGFGFSGQTLSVTGTITVANCGNEYYIVDQNGIGYRLQYSPTFGSANVFPTVGSTYTVSGQLNGNQLVANNIFPGSLPVFNTPSPFTSGTITSLVNTETLSCGVSISTFTFQNDNGRIQQLRVPSNISGQFITTGSRVNITNKIESFDGSVVDALSINNQQQGFF